LFFALRIPVWFFILVFAQKQRAHALVKLNAYVRGIGQIFLNSAYTV
jgi:hypothetical protein